MSQEILHDTVTRQEETAFAPVELVAIHFQVVL